MTGHNRLLYVAVAAVPLSFAGMAPADYFQGPNYTHVGSPFGTEDAHAEILNNVYGDRGGNFSPTVNAKSTGTTWTAYENNQLRLERVLDVPGLDSSGKEYAMDLGDPSMTAADQIWKDGVVNVRADAKFAEFSGDFGYLSGTSGGDFESLFSVEPGNSGYDVEGSATFSIDGNFRWGYDVNQSGLLTSNQDENPQGQDFMATYRVTDLDGNDPAFNGGRPVFLLFWEDWVEGDYDYNDLVIELAVIPLPAPFAMGLIGLAGVAAVRRRMKY